MILKVINRILNIILCSTGSQCNFSSAGVISVASDITFYSELILSQNSVGAEGLHICEKLTVESAGFAIQDIQ